MTTTQTATALDELSALLGVEVTGVRHTGPAHERPGAYYDQAGRVVHGPARDVHGEVERERWLVRIVDPAGVERPAVGKTLSLTLRSAQVRDARELTALLRRLGSGARLDNRSARTVLRLMHEVVESTGGAR